MADARAHAQEARGLTPDQAVRMALEEHDILRSTKYEAKEARAAARQARSAWWPSISSQASYMRLSDNIPPIGGQFPGADTTFTIAPIELNRYHAEVSIEQPLFTGFRRRSRVRSAEHRIEAARAAVDRERTDVAMETREAYWRLFEAVSRREALATSLEQIDTHLDDVRNRLSAGAALRRDLLAARTRRSEIRLDSVNAENAVRAARLELDRLTGLPDNTRIVPQAEMALDSVAVSAEELSADLLDEHPEIQSLRGRIGALEAEVRAVRGEWFPEAALTGRYVYARPNQYFFAQQDEFHGTWEAGVTVRWNLWDGGRRSAETAQVSARLHAARARLEHLEKQITTEIDRQHLEVQGARRSVEVAREGVRAAEETFRVVRQQFQAGTALSADVLEAEAALRSAQTRESDAISRFATARAALLNAAGRVW